MPDDSTRTLRDRLPTQHAGFPRNPLDSPPHANAPLDYDALLLRAAFGSRPRSAPGRKHGCSCMPRVLGPPLPGTKMRWSLRSRAAHSDLASRAADSKLPSATRNNCGNF